MDNETDPDRKDDALLRNGGTDSSEEIRIPLAEERIVVSKRDVSETAARIRMRTHIDDVEVSEALRTERVEIERVPMDLMSTSAPEARVENGVTIIPVIEEVLVVQYRVVEEIRIKLHAETRDHAETVSLRRQEALIEPGTAGDQSDFSAKEDARRVGEFE